jgi:hypothetical protein
MPDLTRTVPPLALPGPTAHVHEVHKVSAAQVAQVIEDAPKLIDEAAKRSDRWWFFVLLMVGIMWTGWNQWKQEQQLAIRDVKIDKLQEQLTTTFSGLVNENTKAVQANTDMLRRVEAELARNTNR